MEQVHSNIGAVVQITKSVIVQGEQAVLVRTVPFGYWRFDSFGHHLRNREEVNPARLITLKPQVRILLPLHRRTLFGQKGYKTHTHTHLQGV